MPPADAEAKDPNSLRVVLSTGSFESLDPPLEWSLPKFGILYGPNGSGKSQLLRLIENALTKSDQPMFIGSDRVEPWQIVRVTVPPDISKASAQTTTPDEVANLEHEASQHLVERNSPSSDFFARERARLRDMWPPDRRYVPPEELTARFGPGVVLPPRWTPDHIPSQIQKQALAWARARARLKESDAVAFEEDILQRLGPAPWTVINRALETAGLQPRMNPPVSALHPYKLTFCLPAEGAGCDFTNLSSGEATLVWIASILAESQASDRGIRVLLCDEPDAHLHSSAIPGFYNAIKSELVARHGCHVLCTTHRAETLAQLPLEDLWQVARNPPRVRQATNRGDAIAVLTANLIEAIPSTRLIYVEGTEDLHFYQAVLRLAEDTLGLERSAQVYFALPSLESNESNGRAKVEKAVRLLTERGLGQFIRGLVDLDIRESNQEGVVTIGRHSHENYLFDPLAIYAALMKVGRSAEIGADISAPQSVSQIREMGASDLQTIASRVLDRVYPQLTPRPSNLEPRRIRYTSGQVIEAPSWLWCVQGHELARAVGIAWKIARRHLQEVFGSLALLDEELRSALSACGALVSARAT